MSNTIKSVVNYLHIQDCREKKIKYRIKPFNFFGYKNTSYILHFVPITIYTGDCVPYTLYTKRFV